MLTTVLFSLLFWFAPSTQVTFELYNDSQEAITLQISEVHRLSIPSESYSEVRLRIGEEIYLVEEGVAPEDRLLILTVDAECAEKSFKLSKLIRQAQKMHKF